MATTYTLGQVAIVSKGDYSPAVNYYPLNAVSHRAGTFMCIAACSNVEPGVTSGWRTYWVPTALGIYQTNVTADGDTITMTFTFSDGTTASHEYTAATPPSVEYKIALGGNASTWTKTSDVDGNALSGILADSKLVVTVAPESFTLGRNYGVRMSSFSAGSISFVADSTVPSGNTVYMTVLVVH
jgi:hypothetical protein